MKGSIATYTLGCKLNFSETSTISRQLETAGFERKSFEQGADIYVINTCSVTDHADRKCKKVVKEALKANPNAFVVIVGCYAQLKPAEIASIPGVDLVLGAAEKFNLIAHLDSIAKKPKAAIFNAPIKETKTFIPSYSFGDRTRTFLKVQDGCDYFCAFCTIPLARGFSRSPKISEVVVQAQVIAASGTREVVLTGVNIGDFGAHGEGSFLELIQALDHVEGIDRFRISSIEPNLLSHEIIQFVAQSKRFVPHFHIPLQSGDNEILRSMRRRYERELYASRVADIRKAMPHASIGVDVIVGFPGETDAHFMNTYQFLNELDISYLHVFPYSERPNTPASKMGGKVVSRVRMERAEQLRILSEKKRASFYQANQGTTRNVLWEAAEGQGMMEGFTDNYIKLKTPYDPLLINELCEVSLDRLEPEGYFYAAEPVIA